MRTEGDAWDINTGVGSTALFVAAARALAAREAEPLAVDPFAEVFVRAAGPEWAELLDGTAPGHPLREPGFGPAFVTFQAARTEYFDDYFHAAIAAGVRQIVLLAAGLDARAYRLPWPDGTVVYELDRAPVLRFKRETLAANGDKPRAERREVVVDLREDWPKALRGSGFDPAAPTAWLVEGLLPYLPAVAVDRLYADIEAISAPGSRVAIEQMDPLPDQVHAALLARPNAVANSPADWARLIYNERRGDAADWFTAHGWRAERIGLVDYLAARGRGPGDRPDGDQPPVSALVSLVTAIHP
ncbi:SAM-dependent methyltransferase [Nocardia sp. CDC159]|uniref:S-adenosyl-L-methionine-dependent methyltransferase n=1 Tax=Nocardia pulmonis TaxID=2951408 RepID=A0A9X2IUH5_9NOCA|nr:MULTISPECIES: SAM-dependent methyltransferase [Nocardia]MCM6772103.1 SAM-dependent methyltransferase [Nocardia pulmonis]MCM6785239.1 SAM-dependent methyltransferase [Nocardia sp. CDC159]